MPTYRVQLRDGRTVRVEAANPQAADAAAGEYMRAKPRPGARGQEGYAKARERIATEQATARKANARFPGGEFLNKSDDFTRRVAGSTGAADEVGGAIMFVRQGAENLFRRATGRPIETTAPQAYMAAQDTEREWQQNFARENPTQNIFASGLGIVASGRPTGGAALTNPFRAGAAVAAQNAPFAVARQEGNLRERAPGAVAETALAFGTGSALTAAGNVVARSGARARARPPSDARRLSAEGVQLTPGRIMGGSAQRIEDGLQSVPVLGDSIRDAQRYSLETFDRAAVNRSLAPIGQQSQTAPGRAAIADASQQISDAYNAALQGVTVQPGRTFSQGVQQALFSRQLPDDAAAEVNAVLQNSVMSRLSGAPIDGPTWKSVDAEIRAAADAARAASAQRPSMRYAADALQDIRRAWQAELQTSAPQAYAGVRAADEATANLARIRQAGQYTGTAGRDGLFTPADLNRAVQAGDSSAGNRAYSEGTAFLQDLSDPAMAVMPSTVPDSGTPFRSILATLGGLGGVAAGGSAVGAGAVTGPAALAAGGVALAGAGIYSRPAMNAINAIYRATTPGQAREALGQLAQLAGRDPALVPVYEEAARALGVPLPAASNRQAQTAPQQ